MTDDLKKEFTNTLEQEKPFLEKLSDILAEAGFTVYPVHSFNGEFDVLKINVFDSNESEKTFSHQVQVFYTAETNSVKIAPDLKKNPQSTSLIGSVSSIKSEPGHTTLVKYLCKFLSPQIDPNTEFVLSNCFRDLGPSENTDPAQCPVKKFRQYQRDRGRGDAPRLAA